MTGEHEYNMNQIIKRKNASQAVNEFEQVVKGNSLGKDAWRRLKKNKMAVISIVIVSIYIVLAVAAPLLPIYPYDEIILDHQHLKPSLTRTAGDLMLEKRLADLYTQAWRQGRLIVSEEEDARLEHWVDKNEVNKVWSFLFKEGNRQLEEGTFTLNTSETRTVNNLKNKIVSDLQITVQTIWTTDAETGKRLDVEKLSAEEIVALYATMVGSTVEREITQYTAEIRQQLFNQIKAESSGLTEEDYQNLLATRLESLSQREEDRLIKANVLSKILRLAKDIAASDLRTAATDATAEFPLNKEIQIRDTLSATVKATKMHERRYYLGTDYVGRDLLSRIIYGGQVSIAIGFIGTLTSVLIGVILGALAGYLGGKVDYFIMRIVDIMYGLPYMLLVIIAMAIFGRNILNLFFALAIISWLTISRMVRGQIMSLKNQEFVEAARSMGASTGRIIFRHLVPNSLSVIIVFSTLRIPSFIMTESFLSFLGLGVQAPYASWGSLVGDAVGGMTLYPWKLFFPAAVMTVFLFAMNFLGDGLRDAFDPQSKNQL